MNTGVIPGAAEGPRPSLVALQCTDPYGDAVTTGEKAAFVVPRAFDGWTVADIYASVVTVSSSGPVVAAVFVNGLSRLMVAIIPEGERISPSGTLVKCNGLRGGDVLTVNVGGAGTGAKGLQVFLELVAP